MNMKSLRLKIRPMALQDGLIEETEVLCNDCNAKGERLNDHC